MAKMLRWNDRRQWSISHDCEMSRVSGYDERGHEFWMQIPAGIGYRERRDEAVKRIMESIEEVDSGGNAVNLPGEVE